MTSSPPASPDSSDPPDALCDRAQGALIDGTLESADREIRAHVEACSECQFLKDLSRNLAGSGTTDRHSGSLWAFIELLDRAVATGELVLSRYRLEARLGFGGQGVVYRATDTDTHEKVALKLLRCHPDRPQASSAEVALAHRVRHPGVCRVYHTQRHGHIRVISMEFISGGSLDQLEQTLSAKSRLQVFRQVCAAVHEAHEAGVLHLDLKPQNILFRSPGEAIVTDFGLAAFIGDIGEQVALGRGGTPGYMAPEQHRGSAVDRRTDVYALGLLLKELFPRPSRHLGRVIGQATREDPAHRFPDAQALLRAVSRPREVRRRSGLVAMVLVGIAPLLAVGPPNSLRDRWFRPSPALTERDSIVLADFVNTTAEPVFDGTLRLALAVQIEQSPYLHVLPDERVRKVLRLMGRPVVERLTDAIAREVCEREGVKAMLAGSIARVGRSYVVGLEATNCRTGDSLAREQREADSREMVLQAVGQAASSLRAKLGESLASIQRFDTPAGDTTTSSLDALKAFSLGEEQRARAGELQALPFYKKAIELDPRFAVAYARLGTIYRNMGETPRSREYHQQSFLLRDHVSEREKLYIENHYYATVTGEIEKQIETLEIHRRTYPRDVTPLIDLSDAYLVLGSGEQALAAAREAARVEPNHPSSQSVLAGVYRTLGRWEEARAVCAGAPALKADSAGCHRELYRIAFFQGDVAEMKRQSEWAQGNPEEYLMRGLEASAAAVEGRLREARELAGEAVELARHRKLNQAAARIWVQMALREAYVGNARLTRQAVAEAVKLDRGPDVLIQSAHALGFAGDVAQAAAWAAEVERTVPATHVTLHAIRLPVTRAAIELIRGAPDKVLLALKPAAPYEGSIFGNGGWYLRGLAHLASGHGAEAAADFQKVIDNPGSGPAAVPISNALARLGLARAAARSGDIARSRLAYQDFLTRWKDADPEVPILVEAKTEYARLAGS